MAHNVFSPGFTPRKIGLAALLLSPLFFAPRDVGAAEDSSPIVVEGRTYHLQQGADLLVPAPSGPNEADPQDEELFRKRRRHRSIQVPSSVQPSTTATPAPRPGMAPAVGPRVGGGGVGAPHVLPVIQDRMANPVRLGPPPIANILRLGQRIKHNQDQLAILDGVRWNVLYYNRFAAEQAVRFASNEPFLNAHPEPHQIGPWRPGVDNDNANARARANHILLNDAQVQRDLYAAQLQRDHDYRNVDRGITDKLWASHEEGVTAHDIEPTHVIYHRIRPATDDHPAQPEYVAVRYDRDLNNHGVINGDEGFIVKNDEDFRRVMQNPNFHMVLADGQPLPENFIDDGIPGPLLAGMSRRQRDIIDEPVDDEEDEEDEE